MGASQFSLTAATKKVPRANQLLPTILPPPPPPAITMRTITVSQNLTDDLNASNTDALKMTFSTNS